MDNHTCRNCGESKPKTSEFFRLYKDSTKLRENSCRKCITQKTLEKLGKIKHKKETENMSKGYKDPDYYKKYYQSNKDKWKEYIKTQKENGNRSDYHIRKKELIAKKRIEIREQVKEENAIILKGINIRENYSLFLLKRSLKGQINRKRRTNLMDEIEFPVDNKDWILKYEFWQFNMGGFETEIEEDPSIWKEKQN